MGIWTPGRHSGCAGTNHGHTDGQVMTSPIQGRDLLVTGGTGSFAQAFVQRALDLGARRVVIFSRGEAKQAQMRATMPDPRLRYCIGDVRDETRLRQACRGVDIVVHAAALKRVEVCEGEPREAVLTNVLGTINVAHACIEAGVRWAVLLSTDKACNPATMYGSTKLSAERAWIQGNVYAAGTNTRFSATRYGNVLGSTGSVVPVWREQMQSGRIKITDPTMTRFWMTMDEAVDLVHLAIERMRGGEVFIPKITSSSLGDLAHAVAPGVEWEVIPVRPGEKIHESLIGADEAPYTYDADTHYLIEPALPLWEHRTSPAAERVPDGFSYASHTNPFRCDASDLCAMLQEHSAC